MRKSLECVIIIPNEEILNVPVYFSMLKDGENHIFKILEFAEKYNLGIELEQGYPAMVLASMGHVVIQIDSFESTSVVYLPKYLSSKQVKILNKYKLKRTLNFFQSNGFFAFGIMDSNNLSVNPGNYIENARTDYETMYKLINGGYLNQDEVRIEDRKKR